MQQQQRALVLRKGLEVIEAWNCWVFSLLLFSAFLERLTAADTLWIVLTSFSLVGMKILFSDFFDGDIAQPVYNITNKDKIQRYIVLNKIQQRPSGSNCFHLRTKRAATARPERIWDYAVIPYEIDANFSGNHKALFKQVCVYFICIKCLFTLSTYDMFILFIYHMKYCCYSGA